jgi:DNA-3-methyladenine glycosylase
VAWPLDSPGRAERARLLAILKLPPRQAARRLLGQVLVRRRGRRVLAARIVEVEAYLGTGDPAAHVFRGRTPRNAPLYGPPGTLYVYFVYGMHHCLNLSVDASGRPGCVLIRAAEPLEGAGLSPRDLAGPGRLCRALHLDRRHSGHHLFEPGASLTLREGVSPRRIHTSPRVGIRHAADRPLRFFDPSSAALSGGPRGAARPMLSSP